MASSVDNKKGLGDKPGIGRGLERELTRRGALERRNRTLLKPLSIVRNFPKAQFTPSHTLLAQNGYTRSMLIVFVSQ